MDQASKANREIFTIGHSNQSLEQFVALLKQHRIAALVDARSYPQSAYAHQFDRQHLKRALPIEGIRYAFLGHELGGRPRGEEYYDEERRVRYDRVAESPFFERGIKQLEAAMPRYLLAVMCSEEDPVGCHRHLLIARVLAQRGVAVLHIRGDGSVQSEEDLAESETQRRRQSGQLALFEEPQETAWRSTRSVLPRRARPNSSAP